MRASRIPRTMSHGKLKNPVSEVARQAINRDEGSTLAFAKAQARRMPDAPPEDTIAQLA
jgi:hypothetical protein